MPLLLSTLTSFATAVALISGEPKALNDVALRQVLANYVTLYDQADARGLASMFTASAVAIGPEGRVDRGQRAIEEGLQSDFAGASKGSHLEVSISSIRPLSGNLAVADGRYVVEFPDQATFQGMFLATFRRENGQWMIEAMMGAARTT